MQTTPGFDDWQTKFTHYDNQHQILLMVYSGAIKAYGESSLQAQSAKIDQYQGFIKKHSILLEQHIESPLFLAHCLLYMRKLEKSYDLEKCRELIEDFTALVYEPDRDIQLRLFMQRNPL